MSRIDWMSRIHTWNILQDFEDIESRRQEMTNQQVM